MADINMESAPIATEDKIVEDAAGRRRQVFAGQPVPGNLVDAYEQAGGGTKDGPPTPAQQDIAESDQTVEDASGRRRQVRAGQKVPPNLVDAYEEAGGTISNKTEVETAPETDKLQRSPDTAKSEEDDEESRSGDISAARKRRR